MFRNYIITAARTLWKNRLFSLVNILGLSVGLAIALVIYLYVSAELSYDKFHAHGDQIYRVLRIGNINGEKYLIGVTSPPYATALETDFPASVRSTVRVLTSDGQVTYQNHSFREENLFLADGSLHNPGDHSTVRKRCLMKRRGLLWIVVYVSLYPCKTGCTRRFPRVLFLQGRSRPRWGLETCWM